MSATSLASLKLASSLMETLQQSVDGRLWEAQSLADDCDGSLWLLEFFKRMVAAEND